MNPNEAFEKEVQANIASIKSNESFSALFNQ